MSDQDDITPDDVDTDLVDDADDATEGADSLGDAGKKALDAMKAKWQKERDARKALEDQIAKRPKDDKTDAPDPEAIREQGRKEARMEGLKERALDKIEVKAAKLFADPEDAVAHLARRADDFIDGESLDLDAIDEALQDLLKKRPHLAAQGGKRFNGSADGGARKGSGKPTQLTEQDLKRMTPQQIVDARGKGQFDELLGAT